MTIKVIKRHDETNESPRKVVAMSEMPMSSIGIVTSWGGTAAVGHYVLKTRSSIIDLSRMPTSWVPDCIYKVALLNEGESVQIELSND